MSTVAGRLFTWLVGDARVPGDRPLNLDKPALYVKWSELTRPELPGAYKSVCPACTKGLLLVTRDQKTFALSREDRCILCGQLVHYTDDSINGEAFDGNQDR